MTPAILSDILKRTYGIPLTTPDDMAFLIMMLDKQEAVILTLQDNGDDSYMDELLTRVSQVSRVQVVVTVPVQ